MKHEMTSADKIELIISEIRGSCTRNELYSFDSGCKRLKRKLKPKIIIKCKESGIKPAIIYKIMNIN